MRRIRLISALFLGFSSLSLLAACSSSDEATSANPTQKTASPTVSFANIKDGDTLKNPITVKFGVSGMAIVPAGTEQKNSGHHHLLIDTSLSGEALTQPIPSDDNHRHFGKGQTDVELTLKPGKHTLQLVLGDHNHIPHTPPILSKVITITVE